MIQYDETELCYSDFDDSTLRLIENLLGPEVRNKLLITPEQVSESVRLCGRHHPYVTEERRHA